MADEVKKDAQPISNWLDTRTVIVCWMMLSCFIIIYLFWLAPPKAADSQLLNTLVGIYFGTGLVTAIQWWMGSAKGSDANNKMQDKMSDAIRPASPPVEPDVVVAWWSILTDAERGAITAAALTDSRAAAFVAASATGKASPADLDYLVTKGLLTRDRATAIAALEAPTRDALNAAAIVAPAAAAAAAPIAAAAVAPPAADVAAPPAARKAVADAMEEQGLTTVKPKELP